MSTWLKDKKLNIRLMFSKGVRDFLIWLAAACVAVSSCAGGARELASYWDGYDFSSLDGFDDITQAEEKFDGYIDLLNKVPHETAVANLRSFLDSAARNTVAYMVWSGWFEPYFHSFQSPYRNEELYAEWLDMVLEDKILEDEGMMEHLGRMKTALQKNKPGSTLEDVVLRDCNGEELMLSEMINRQSMILLVDANCPSCLESLEENVGAYKDANLIAILVNGGSMHIRNIRRQVSEDILEKWTLLCCSQRMLEDARYDLYNMPVRLLVAQDGKIIKSYH